MLGRLAAIKQIAPFGINYVVNLDTFPDIDAAISIAEECNASEFLLLPEQPVKGRGGITRVTAAALQNWVGRYRGSMRLTVSEQSSDGMPICNPLGKETALQAYAHINAHGILKHTSFDYDGVVIGDNGVMSALNRLNKRTKTAQ